MQGMAYGAADRGVLDARVVVGHLVRPGSVFAFLADHRGELFPDEAFAELFPSGTGRPSIPAEVIASVLVLQTLHDLSDREAVEALRCDIRWKVACGLALTDEGFDPSTLVYWRRRLAASQAPHRIWDAVKTVIEATGVIKGNRRRALDSTILEDAVATQDTVTQLIAAIRRVGREVPGAAEWIAAGCAGHDDTKPGKPTIDWDDPQARDALVSALVNDATLVVQAFGDAELTGKQTEAVALLALVAGQDVEPAEGSDGTDGRWRVARTVAPDRVISTVDQPATQRHLRCRLPRLPTATPLHHQQARPRADPAPPRRPAPPSPPRLGAQRPAARALQPAPAPDRTRHRPAGPTRRTPPEAALHRRYQERLLAPPTRRRPQPRSHAQPRAHPPGRHLGARGPLTASGSRPTSHGLAAPTTWSTPASIRPVQSHRNRTYQHNDHRSVRQDHPPVNRPTHRKTPYSAPS